MVRGRVSVVVPVYNVEKYLKDCVDSILSQTYPEVEIVLVDDGATDSSGKICDEITSTHRNVITVHQENRGLSGARNTGIGISTGEYIMFVDSDDLIRSRLIGELVHSIEKYQSDIAVCNGENFYEGTYKSDRICCTKREMCLEGAAGMNQIVATWNSACSKLYRRSLFERFRFREGRLHEDGLFMADIFETIQKVSFSPYFGYLYRKGRQGSIMTNGFRERDIDALVSGMRLYQLLCRYGYYKTANKRLTIQYRYLIYKLTRIPIFQLLNWKREIKKMRIVARTISIKEIQGSVDRDTLFKCVCGRVSIVMTVLITKARIRLGKEQYRQ